MSDAQQLSDISSPASRQRAQVEPFSARVCAPWRGPPSAQVEGFHVAPLALGSIGFVLAINLSRLRRFARAADPLQRSGLSIAP